MFIEIKNIKFKNFMSYIEESEYAISNGVSLINGTNGKGKSSILEAIYYGLFGKPFRKISNSELINSTSGKNLEVQITFQIQEDTYDVIRGMRPAKFEIYKNNDLIIQDSKTIDYQKMFEEKILKTTDSVFKQLVLLGANIPTSKNFSELSNREREEIFKYIIDIGIFSVYNEISRARIKELKNELLQTDTKIDQLKNLKSKLKTDIERQELQNATAEETKASKINELNTELTIAKDNLDKFTSALDLIGTIDTIKQTESMKLAKEIKQNLEESKAIIQSDKQRLNLIENLEKSHNCCINCDQLVKISGIDVKEKDTLLSAIKIKQNLVNESEIELKTLVELLKAKQEKQEKIIKIEQRIKDFNNTINVINEKILLIGDIKEAIIDYSIIKDIDNQEKQLVNGKVKLEQDLIDFMTFDDLISAKNLKGKILDMSLPIINKWINYFLEKFGNFPFLFTINSDLSESIISMDGSNLEKSFNGLSNGQKLRIVFSILFAFLKYSEERNTTHFNILFLDEVLDSSLDTEGRLELIHILRTEFQDRSINIVSHNTEIKEAEEVFEYIYEVLSNENGSYLTKLKE